MIIKKIIPLFALLVSLTLQAQKKLIPVSASALSGISLPEGSKEDKRFLSVVAGKALLETETKKSGSTVSKTEILVLPPTPDPAVTTDSIKQLFQTAGWTLIPGTDQTNYWLERNGTRLIAYFSSSKKENSLYLGETTGQLPGTHPANTDPQQPQQPDPIQGGQQGLPQDNQQGNTQPPQQVTQPASGSSGIIISTSNFDDGWIARPQADWVQVSKNNLTAYIHYAISLPDELRSGDGDPILNYFWNLLITPRYNVSSLWKMPFDPYAYKRTYYMEGTATENQTGQTVYLAFRILINSGIATCIEISGPSKDQYQALFPDLDKVANMTTYNRFAVSPDDVTGLWKESTGGFAQYYNVYNGNYAGMNAVSINTQFRIGTDGNCSLEHKGAGGMVGNQQFFSEKYAGRYTMSNWEFSFTDQNGKLNAYHIYYQAVKNGRILYMQNKQFTGQEYFLMKAE